MWLHSLKVAQLLRSAACLHTNQSRSYLNHLVFCFSNNVLRSKKGIVHATLNFRILEMASDVAFDKLDLCANFICLAQFHLIGCRVICLFLTSLKLILIFSEAHPTTARPISK